MNSQELKIQPLFSKPLGFTKIHLTDDFIDWVKKTEYRKIEFGYQSVDEHLLDKFSYIKHQVEKEVQAFNDNVMVFDTPIKLTRSWSTKYEPNTEGEVHIHNNATYSFVLYINKGESCQFQNWPNDGLRPHVKGYNIFNMTSFNMPVEQGSLLIFLSNTPHKILKTNEERYSVAGNYIITDMKEFKIV